LYVVPLPLEEGKYLENQPNQEGEQPKLIGMGPSKSGFKVPLSETLDRFCQEISQSLENKNLKWEAELELGVEFGFTIKTKIKISPKD
jgi:hypothetical protein